MSFHLAIGHWELSLSDSCLTRQAGSTAKKWRMEPGSGEAGLVAEPGYNGPPRKTITCAYSEVVLGKEGRRTLQKTQNSVLQCSQHLAQSHC